MYAYSLFQWILFFLFYCFVGWCIETTHVSVHSRQFVNRGFLYGPVIPIYGFGAIAILFVTLPVRAYLVAVFFLGMLAASLLEYVTGVAMEAIFKVRYWDYSDNSFNLNGHICLGTSLAWGVLSVALVRWIHAPIERLICAIPLQWAQVLVIVLSGIFLADLALSIKAALDLRKLLDQLQARSEKAKEEVRQLQTRMEEHAAARKAELAEYLNQKLPDGGEALQNHIERLEQAVARLEQTEGVQKLRTDMAAWKARHTTAREFFHQRMTWDQRALLRNNPKAHSKRYAAPLRLLRERLAEEKREHDAKRKSRKS